MIDLDAGEEDEPLESGRIKSIVIVILVLLDAVLLALVGARRARQAGAAAEARSAAAEIIRADGVLLEDDALPGAMTLAPMEAARDEAAEEAAARAVLGDGMQTERPGGGVLRCSSERGTVQFHSTGEFWAGFADGAFPVAAGQSPAEHGAQFLRKMGFEPELLQDGTEGGAGTVIFRQTLDGAPVLDCRAALRYVSGALVQISDARRLIGPPVKRGSADAADPATVLMGVWHGLTALGDPCGQIYAVVPAYECGVSLSGGARLTPVWWVRTDRGEYRLDARGRTLMRGA